MGSFTTSIMPRLSLGLAMLSSIFWFTSWPPVSLGEDFPNCISARWVIGDIAVGCLSHSRLSSLFVERNHSGPGNNRWSERSDGHFCGFPIPPSDSPLSPPTGFNVHLSRDAVAWDCPYWLMTGIWLAMFVRSRPAVRSSLSELLAATAVVAVVGTLIQWRVALLLTAPLNFLTAALVIWVAGRCAWWLLHDETALWPLAAKQTTANDVSA